MKKEYLNHMIMKKKIRVRDIPSADTSGMQVPARNLSVQL